MDIIGPLFGRYSVMGDSEQADCIMGHSFGTDISPGSVNRLIVDTMKKCAKGRPIIADRMLVQADSKGEKAYAHIIDVEITKKDGRSGTGRALKSAKQYMDEHNLSNPIMIAQRYHIDRVVRQAAKLGLRSIVPPDLPERFDKQSEQFWTRSKLLFIPLNAVAYIKLKMDGEL